MIKKTLRIHAKSLSDALAPSNKKNSAFIAGVPIVCQIFARKAVRGVQPQLATCFHGIFCSRELPINTLILGEIHPKSAKFFKKCSSCPFNTESHPLASMCSTCRCRGTPGPHVYAGLKLANR